jgi:uncharacterized membrane protein
MAILIIVLRATHILGGIFWTGASLVLYGFVVPSANATRPDSSRFMQHLAASSGLTVWMQVASWATVICGVALFAPVTGQLEPAIMRSPRGMLLSVGALLAIGAFLEGIFVTGPAGQRIAAVGREILATGKAPTPEQVQQLLAVQGRLQRAGMRGAIMLTLAAVLMAVARYV